ncbi:CHAT domain-containing protein [Mesorhizobium sp. BHbdii]
MRDQIVARDRMRITDGWEPIVRKIEQYTLEIFWLEAAFQHNTLTITGQVATEAVRRYIEELARSYPEASKVNIDIEVTAPFSPAGDIEYFGSPSKGIAGNSKDTRVTGNVTVDTDRTVRRFPAISSDEQPRPGDVFRFEVNLDRTRHDNTEAEAIELSDLEAGWKTLDVDVEVNSKHLRFASGANTGTITIVRNGNSLPARFEATVDPDLAGEGVRVLAAFELQGRFTGAARREFAIQKPDATAAPRIATPADPPKGSMGLAIGAAAPELTLKILKADDKGTYIWSCSAPREHKSGGGRASELVGLGDTTREFAQTLLNACPTLAPGVHAGVLQGIGEDIWKRAPNAFKDLYFHLNDVLGPHFPIQIITDEPYVPWEMMRPQNGNDVEWDHLYLAHPITRWFADYEMAMPRKLNRGIVATCVPSYTGKATLQFAAEEAEFLVASYGAQRIGATCGEFVAFWTDKMPSQPVGILHFAGHGIAADGTTAAAISMSDGEISAFQVNSSVKLGRRDSTFVVLNACEVGATSVKLGLADGWAAKLLENRFGGVMAPIWAVQDRPASLVVRDHISQIMAGASLGQAMLSARRTHKATSATPFAYLVYGDVMARMT